LDPGATLRIRRAASMPLRPGKLMSSTITSGCCSRACSTASNPSDAMLTTCNSGWPSNNVHTLRRIASESSTTKTRSAVIVCSMNHLRACCLPACPTQKTCNIPLLTSTARKSCAFAIFSKSTSGLFAGRSSGLGSFQGEIPQGARQPYGWSSQLAAVATATSRKANPTAMPPPNRMISLKRSDFIRSSGRISCCWLRCMGTLEAGKRWEGQRLRRVFSVPTAFAPKQCRPETKATQPATLNSGL